MIESELKRVFCNCDGSYGDSLARLQSQPPEHLSPLLFQMIHFRSFPLLKLIIELGADVNYTSENGMTPLLYACSEGQIEMVKHLAKLGALRLAFCNKGFSALTYAARSLSLPMVKWACQQGCDPNHRDINGMTVLHAVVARDNAAEKEEEICVILEFLLKEGAVIPDTFPTPFQIAEANHLTKAAKILNDHTPKPSFFDSYHPLWLLAPHLILLLLEQGADINEKDPDGMTPLSLAVSRGAFSQANILIENGADISVVDGEGWTLLDILSMHGSEAEAVALTEKLIGMGLSVNAKH